MQRAMSISISAIFVFAIILVGINNIGVINIWNSDKPLALYFVPLAIALGFLNRNERLEPTREEESPPNWPVLLVFGGALVVLAADQFYRNGEIKVFSAVGIFLILVGLILKMYKIFMRN